MALKTSDLVVDGLRAYLAQPEHSGSGGVLVLPTIAGNNQQLKEYCHWIAAEGFTALAWDPFSAYPADTAPDEFRRIALNDLKDEPAYAEQSRWLDYMQRELHVDNIAVMGFCLGGRMVFPISAREERIKLCIAYHPSISSPQGDAVLKAPGVSCPALVHYPGKDHITSHETLAALRTALETRTAPTMVNVYPEAVHGFMDGARQGDPANAAATALSWPITIASLRTCLTPA